MVVGGRVLGWTAAAVLAMSVVTLLASSALRGAKKPRGALTQLAGKAGCFTHDGASEDGAGTCGKARGMAETESAIVSPDGRNVYVGSYPNSGAGLGAGFAIFKRNTKTGALAQLSGKPGCLTTDGSSNAGAGTCTEVRGLLHDGGDGIDVAITKNGKWAYIAADDFPASLLIFHRNTKTGALKQLSGTAGCITTDGTSQAGAGTCKTDAHLLDASGVTFSSDEKFLYVTGTGGSDQIEVYAHNKKTGALKDIECISQAPAPSGCSTGRVVGDTQAIALSPNGKYAYAGQYQYGMSIFNRNPKTGKLTQKSGTAGCITDDGNDNTGAATCTAARAARATFPLLIAPNGHTLYNMDSHIGFSTFHINKNGTLKQLSGKHGCTTIDGVGQQQRKHVHGRAELRRALRRRTLARRAHPLPQQRRERGRRRRVLAQSQDRRGHPALRAQRLHLHRRNLQRRRGTVRQRQGALGRVRNERQPERQVRLPGHRREHQWPGSRSIAGRPPSDPLRSCRDSGGVLAIPDFGQGIRSPVGGPDALP